MRILVLLSDTYLPQHFGGLRTSTDQLCRGLVARGHDVIALCGITSDDVFGLIALAKMKANLALRGRKIQRDRWLGYRVWRSWFPLDDLAYVVGIERPDVVIAAGGNIVEKVAAVQALGLPVVAHVHDVAFHLRTANTDTLKSVPIVTNSAFTAGRYRDLCGILSSVIYPVLDADFYRTPTRRKDVLLGSPMEHKGGALALELARRCPEIPFRFATTCALRDAWGMHIMREVQLLRNVSLAHPTSGMKRFYRNCKVVLMPSLVEEGYGRMVAEAQVSGIPALASNHGALPEAVGAGGVLLDPKGSIDAWVTALRRMWTDAAYYDALSAQALKQALRPELTYSHQVAAHETILIDAIKTGQAVRPHEYAVG